MHSHKRLYRVIYGYFVKQCQVAAHVPCAHGNCWCTLLLISCFFRSIASASVLSSMYSAYIYFECSVQVCLEQDLCFALQISGFCFDSHTQSYKDIQSHTLSYRVIQSPKEPYRVIQSQTQSYIIIHSHTKSCGVIHSNKQSYIVKHSHTQAYIVMHSHTQQGCPYRPKGGDWRVIRNKIEGTTKMSVNL